LFQLDSLEEKDLRFLLWTAITGTSNPDPASNGDETEPVLPFQRNRETASGKTPKPVRGTSSSEVSSTTTKNLEKEKLPLKEIDTSGKKGKIKQFFARAGY
jgi:hypothetical protein